MFAMLSRWSGFVLTTVCSTAMTVAIGGAQDAPDARPLNEAIVRATRYLVTEVPRWRQDHPCYSCHNNGDAARALLAAASRGHATGDALADTIVWLSQPERWDSNQSRGGSEDLPLGRIQFANALASIAASGPTPQAALDHAARQVISHQAADGAWRLNESQTIGGPTFYGTSLATAMARRALSPASREVTAAAIAKADAWLRNTVPVTVLDASASIIGLAGDADTGAQTQRGRSLQLLVRGQGPDGGWGPYVTSQSEPFDTALALLALRAAVRSATSVAPYSPADLAAALRRGRDYLLTNQEPAGSWPETTRPSGGESYAQRISTTAWALLALLEIE